MHSPNKGNGKGTVRTLFAHSSLFLDGVHDLPVPYAKMSHAIVDRMLMSPHLFAPLIETASYLTVFMVTVAAN